MGILVEESEGQGVAEIRKMFFDGQCGQVPELWLRKFSRAGGGVVD